ncbi:MAG: ABC transporter ATP-binding protein, partial [Pseudomonadota bacterium]
RNRRGQNVRGHRLKIGQRGLGEIEARLGDSALYADEGRRDELTRLLKDQAEHKSLIESQEWEWLEASEQLEAAGAD